MNEITQRIRQQIRDRLEIGIDGLGLDMTEDIRQAISTPVEYEGDRVIRSQRGEDPRRDYGHLHDSQRYEVTNPDANTIRLSNINDAHYARRLNNDLNRPFFTHAFQRWIPQIKGRVTAALKGR